MASTKQQLLGMGDLSTKTVPLGEYGEVIIRRLKLKERNEIANLTKDSASDTQTGLLLTRILISKAVVEPAMTPEEADDLPVPVADAISEAIMEFNGWSKEGQAKIRDHFRAAS